MECNGERVGDVRERDERVMETGFAREWKSKKKRVCERERGIEDGKRARLVLRYASLEVDNRLLDGVCIVNNNSLWL
jgi:hypothetical protein